MKLSIILRTSEYRGDHAADVCVAHEAKPGETVEQLASRILKERTDCLEIQRIEEAPTEEAQS